jgi:hypothetical protein
VLALGCCVIVDFSFLVVVTGGGRHRVLHR